MSGADGRRPPGGLDETPGSTARTTGLRADTRIRYGGFIVLLLGLIAAAEVYLTAGAPAPDPTAEITSAPGYEYNLERIGGKAAVYTDRFNRWFTSLWHGQRLAATLAVLAVLIALACFKVAQMVEERSSDAGDENRVP
jgi:hypothetical protein